MPNTRTAIYGLAFSPDGAKLATASADKTVRVWDTASGETTHTLAEGQRQMLGVAFSPNGAQLATCGLDRVVRIYDPNWQPPMPAEEPAEENPDAAAAGAAAEQEPGEGDEPAEEKPTGPLVKEVTEGADTALYGLSWSIDNNYVVAAGRGQGWTMWQPAAETVLIRAGVGHNDVVYDVAYTGRAIGWRRSISPAS